MIILSKIIYQSILFFFLTFPEVFIPRMRQIKTKTHAANKDNTNGHSMLDIKPIPGDLFNI